MGWGVFVWLCCDYGKFVGDLFIVVMNMIFLDFKRLVCFGIYVVCYFSEVSGDGDVFDLFGVVLWYLFMDRFEEVYFCI